MPARPRPSAHRRAALPAPAPAMLDWFAVAQGPEGWLIAGRAAQPWPARLPMVEARFEAALLTGPLVTAFGPPEAGGSHPFLALLQAPRPPCGRLLALMVDGGAIGWAGDAASTARPAPDAGRAGRVLLAGAITGEATAALRGALPQPALAATSTLDALGLPIRLVLDAVIRVPPDGIALAGALLDPSRLVARVALRQGDLAIPLDRDSWAETARPDLATAHPGDETAALSGFIAHAPAAAGATHIEIETIQGELGHVPLPAPQDGARLQVIRQFLGLPRQRLSRMAAVMDQTIGPIVRGLNGARLAQRPQPRRRDYGPPPAAPDRSVVIPLHGRLDFMPIQLALFAAQPDPGAELIFALDDPQLWNEAERQAQSCLVRFGLPFTLLDLGANLGYAPANNAGLAEARGARVCLLNADVFPRGNEGLGWLPRLCAPLDDPAVGAVGALLLFEDGTVQHDGMAYARIPSLPPWPFPRHPRKGLLPDPTLPAQEEVAAVTGACLAARRSDLLALGGLDEDCILADFEDAALCEALRARGQRILLRRDVVLHHLERQTPGSDAPWRFTATLANASHFAARWQPDAEG